MAEFTENLQSIRPSFPFLDNIDPSMELLNQFMGINTHHVMDNNTNLNMQQNLMPFSSDSIILGPPQEPEFPANLEENFHGLVHHVNPIFPPENEVHQGRKRKSVDIPESSSANSTPAVSESGSKTKLVNFFYYYFFNSFLFFIIFLGMHTPCFGVGFSWIIYD